MKEFIPYLLQVIAISGILYSYYYFALKNKRFHRYNRFYLLAATLLSITLPLLNIPIYLREPEQGSSVIMQSLTVISPGTLADTVNNETLLFKPVSKLSGQLLGWFFYSLVAFILFLRVLFSLLKIRSIILRNPVKFLNRIRFVATNEPGAPFSFFRWMIWNNKIEIETSQGQQIFRHELFHIEQKHSRDAMYTEFLTVIFWFNPFFHLIKKELLTLHEFLADQFAINGDKKWQYAELLLMQAMNTQHHLINPFFHNQIKRRIAMITHSPKPGQQYLRKLIALPLAALILMIFAFNYKVRNNSQYAGKNNGPLTVVIDVGHGGKDGGAVSADGTYEKDITLGIAQKIQALSENTNLRILLTRETDELPELKTRSEFSNQQHASLFLSIHVNASKDRSKKGMEVVIPHKKKGLVGENKALASVLLSYLGQIHQAEPLIYSREYNLWVLENSNCPSALIECGYMSNERDLQFIKNPANQEKIARHILLAINHYLSRQQIPELTERVTPFVDTTKPNKANIESKVLAKVESEASFPGGVEKWNKYLDYALNKSVPADNNAPVGDYTVVVQFIVNLDGTIKELKPLTRHGYGMEEETMRILKKGPRWVPAIQKGRQVVAYKKVMVNFFIKTQT